MKGYAEIKMKKICQTIIIFASTLSLSACANLHMANVHPEWNPQQGYEWAKAQCKASANVGYGRDWIDLILHNEEKAYKSCMIKYGYGRINVDRDSNKKYEVCE